MRKFALIAVGLLAAGLATPSRAAELEKVWELDGLRWPESVLPDPKGDVMYVSNVDGEIAAKDGKGEISKVSPDGKMIEADWVTGLNAPKGMGLAGDTLYVADVDELVAIDVATGKIKKKYLAEGAQFLNDVAVGPDGRVYVSDTKTDTIWMMEKDSIMPFRKGDKLNGPNGLLVDADKRLLVAQFGKLAANGQPEKAGHIVAIAFDAKSIGDIGEGAPIGHLDGLAVVEPGYYLVTDFIKGSLIRISSAGKAETLAALPPTSADLAYVPDKRLAIVPSSKAGKLIAFKIPENNQKQP